MDSEGVGGRITSHDDLLTHVPIKHINIDLRAHKDIKLTIPSLIDGNTRPPLYISPTPSPCTASINSSEIFPGARIR